MLHLLYILLFTIVAFLAIRNLIHNLITLGGQSRSYNPAQNYHRGYGGRNYGSGQKRLHPELLDDRGKPIQEPLLVMRSVTMEDARKRLDAIYNASPGGSNPETEDQE